MDMVDPSGSKLIMVLLLAVVGCVFCLLPFSLLSTNDDWLRSKVLSERRRIKAKWCLMGDGYHPTAQPPFVPSKKCTSSASFWRSLVSLPKKDGEGIVSSILKIVYMMDRYYITYTGPGRRPDFFLR